MILPRREKGTIFLRDVFVLLPQKWGRGVIGFDFGGECGWKVCCAKTADSSI